MSAEVKVMEEEWDFLIVLDACRYDYFEKHNFFGGELERRISLGSNTCEWLKKNFDEYYPDTIYISGNPSVSKIWMEKELEFDEIPFLFLDRVWDYGFDWNILTVPPEKVTWAALRDRKKFPEYKMIIHYMQPHHPFIGLWEGMKKIVNLSWKTGKGIWNLLKDGLIEPLVVQTAYERNLLHVLWAISELIEGVKGRIVVTSDHGDCFGEYGVYGHPGGKRIKPLVEVPWLHVKEKK